MSRGLEYGLLVDWVWFRNECKGGTRLRKFMSSNGDAKPLPLPLPRPGPGHAPVLQHS
jgi:hypothetical protein